MEHRYSLRFESGERAGETIPIRGQGFTIGRRPGHALQILDNSVSGHHAEIVLDAQGALLRDLGSTNGTRVRGERIVEKRLVAGDRVQFGGIELLFLDASASGSAAGDASAAVGGGAAIGAGAAVGAGAFGSATGAASASGASGARGAAGSGGAAGAGTPGASTSIVAAASGEAVLRVSPEILARSRKKPIAGLVGLAVLVVAAAGLWLWSKKHAPAAEAPAKPVKASSDNLLGDDASFENDSDGWKAVEGAPAAFVRSPEGRVSGANGLVGDLADGGWALHRSREARAEAQRTLTASAEIRVDAGAVGQVGIELSPAEGPDAAGPVVAWSNPVETPGKFTTCSVSTLVPAGFETARVLLLGRSASTHGTVAADDASLSTSGSVGPAPVIAGVASDWQLALLGEASAAVLSRSGRPLVTSLAFAAGSEAPALAQAARATATAEAGRITLAATKRDGVSLRAETSLVRAGIASTGAEGFAAHGPDFERARARSLLLGKGTEAVRILFASPVSLKGVAEGSASRIEARPADGAEIGEIVLQLDFAEDRKKAGDLAYAARNAERKGDLGECLAKWSELLNGVPFDEALVTEGDAKRASLVQQGLSELSAVRVEVERARFFRLVDLDRRCRERALAVGAKYKGSEVDAEAQRIAAAIDVDLVGLEADLARTERGRLESILSALEATKSTGLAAEVRAHLDRMPKRAGDAQTGPKRPGETDAGRDR